MFFFFLKVPSSAVSCFHDGKQYLYLACRDGFVRIYDCQYKALILPVIEGPKRKALVCMKVSKDKVMTCFCSITRLSLIETRHKFNWNRYFIRSNESSWWDWFNSLNYSTWFFLSASCFTFWLNRIEVLRFSRFTLYVIAIDLKLLFLFRFPVSIWKFGRRSCMAESFDIERS